MLASLTLLRRTNSEKLQFRGCMCLWNDMMADLTPSTLRIVHLLGGPQSQAPGPN